jgi:hypothetical protein
VDLNGDGNIDLLGAGFAGYSYIFYGNKDGSFSEAVILKDKSDTEINLGKYYDFKTNKYVTLGKEEHEEKGDFVKAHDWDNDGDLDLIISGNNVVKLRMNEGTKTNPLFGIKNIEILSKYYADAIVDWDGDGLWDILGGSKKGGVYFFKNTGKLGSPSFGKAICLFEPAAFVNKTTGGRCGITQLTVADWNNDGKLDLIIGNNNTVNDPMPEFSAEELKEKDMLEKKFAETENRTKAIYDNIQKKYGDDKDGMREALKNNKNFNELSNESWEIYQKLISKFLPEGRSHGYVWLSLRK